MSLNIFCIGWKLDNIKYRTSNCIASTQIAQDKHWQCKGIPFKPLRNTWGTLQRK